MFAEAPVGTNGSRGRDWHQERSGCPVTTEGYVFQERQARLFSIGVAPGIGVHWRRNFREQGVRLSLITKWRPGASLNSIHLAVLMVAVLLEATSTAFFAVIHSF